MESSQFVYDNTQNEQQQQQQQYSVIDLLGKVDSQRLIEEEVGDDDQVVVMNKMSSREMESLTAICDALLPSLDAPGSDDDESMANLFRTSASMIGVPEHCSQLICNKLDKYHVFQLRLALLLLSTWIGTFILCGKLSLSSTFPYCQNFSKMDLTRRQQAMLSWSHSWLPHIKKLFFALKMLACFSYFTKVDAKNQNPTWAGIGYCGPDPDFLHTHKQQPKSLNQDNQSEQASPPAAATNPTGPLSNAIIDMSKPKETVTKRFNEKGFHVHRTHHQKSNFHPSDSDTTMTIHCDAVVVGSGSGGGVVAGLLSKAGYKVVVLEKGSYFARNNLTLLEGQSLDQMYESGGMLPTRDVKMMILAGSTVGGGSTVNWSASFRTPRKVLEEWVNEYELEVFGSQLYEEAMEVVCKKMGVQDEIEVEGFNNEVLRRGCMELGYCIENIPRNAESDHYCGWCFMGCKDGKKKGNQETWLMELVESGNGVILPDCEAVRILHCGIKDCCNRKRKAKGVVFEYLDCKGKKEICVVECKVIVVACGALNTPPLLRKSGLKNRNIGKNLHLHPVVMGWGYFPESQLDCNGGGEDWEWKWIPENHKRSYEGGIMTAMSVMDGTDPKNPGYGVVLQTPSLHPGLFSVLMPWISDVDMKLRMSKFSRTAHFIAIARDKGSGQVVGTNPKNLKYQLDPIDAHNLKRGKEKMLRILAAAGAQVIGTHDQNGASINLKKASSHEFERFVKTESQRDLGNLATPLASAHQMGSCRMGISPKSSVVDPRGETWEVKGLYVADSSVFPTALGINPMVTVMATAYCIAQSVLEDLKRKRNGL